MHFPVFVSVMLVVNNLLEIAIPYVSFSESHKGSKFGSQLA
jgi:hypothetical protein